MLLYFVIEKPLARLKHQLIVLLWADTPIVEELRRRYAQVRSNGVWLRRVGVFGRESLGYPFEESETRVQQLITTTGQY